jgi:DNA-directed RNA polymerase sigma subunit (sigma70/sigma32)
MATLTANTKTDQLKEYLGLMQHIRPLAPHQEKACLSLLQAGDHQARRHLVENYLPRVVSWVAPMRGQGLTFEELIEAGNQSVIRNLEAGLSADNLEEKLRQAVLSDMDSALQQVYGA